MLFGHDEGKNIKQLCDGTKDVVCIKMGGTGASNLTDVKKNLGIKANSDRIDNVESTLATKATKEELNVQKLRIDQFVALAEGSTTGDAELQDIRIGADGTIYDSAGDAVRGQIYDLKSDLIDSFIETNIYDSETNRENVYYRTGGIITASSAWQASKLYPLEDGYSYYYKGINNLGSAPVCCYFDATKAYISEFKSASGRNRLNIPANAKYVAFSIKNEDVITFELVKVVSKDLVTDIFNMDNIINSIQGVWSDGSIGVINGSLSQSTNNKVVEVSANNRLRTGYLINPYSDTNITVSSGYQVRAFVYDINFNLLSVTSWGTNVDIINNPRLFRLVIKKTDDSDLTLDDFASCFGNNLDSYYQLFNLKGMIDELRGDDSEIESGHKINLIASIENSAWSWWMYPQVVINENYRKIAAFGEVDSCGVAGIGQINLETNQELKINVWKPGRDDHNGMAILKVDLEHFLIAGTKHDDEKVLHLWRSMNRNSLDVLNPEVTIEFPGTVTYAQLFNTPDNKVVLFTRVGVSDWYACYSKDAFGEEWNEPFKLISTSIQYYCMFRPTTNPNIINVAMYSNPNQENTDTRIRFAYYDITNKALFDLDGNALTTPSGYTSYTNVPIVVDIPEYSPTGITRNRLLDVAITAPTEYAILYCRFTDETDGVYYANINGNTYRIVEAGGCFYNPSCYYGGAVFVPKDTSIIYLSRYYNSRYHLEKYTLIDGEYKFVEEIDSSNTDGLIYPVCRPIIDADGRALFYQKGCTLLTSFQRYAYDAKYILLD